MIDRISVIIPTYNPDAGRLSQIIAALQKQTLEFDKWELIIVDNNSTLPVVADLNWHPNSCLVTEPRQGLTYARLKGFETATGTMLILVDDDNILAADYLQTAATIFKSNPRLGAIGGKSLPIFETAPPKWINSFYGNLALRDLGEDIMIGSWENNYPNHAPIGAGMCLRRLALNSYLTKIKNQPNIITDRTGTSLSSGGDNDMVLEILKSGWQVGYFPSLTLQHIIPQKRMEPNYLARLAFDTNRSWVKLLESHHINPWKKIAPWTLPMRIIKLWFTLRVGGNKVNYVKWKGCCGMLKALAEI